MQKNQTIRDGDGHFVFDFSTIPTQHLSSHWPTLKIDAERLVREAESALNALNAARLRVDELESALEVKCARVNDLDTTIRAFKAECELRGLILEEVNING